MEFNTLYLKIFYDWSLQAFLYIIICILTGYAIIILQPLYSLSEFCCKL